MSRPLSLILILASLTLSFSQSVQIKVVDNDNLQPIGGVYLYDNEGGIDSTDARGRATLRELKDEATVLIKHRLYKTKELSFDVLKKHRTVALIPVEESAEKAVGASGLFSERYDSVPGTVRTVNRKSVDLYNPQTSADLLAATDEVYLQKDRQGGGDPMIRGFTANSLLFTIDGVRMNNSVYRSDRVTSLMSLDPNALESVDVVYGPASTLFGGDAMGGAVNFHLREPVISPDGSPQKNGAAFGRFSLATMEKTGSANFNYSRKNIGWLTSVSFSDFGDVRMGSDTMPVIPVKTGDHYGSYTRERFIDPRVRVNQSGNVIDSVVENADPRLQKNSGYRVFDVLEKIKMVMNSGLVLNGSLYFSTTGKVPRYQNLINPVSPVYAENYDGPQRWLFGTVALDGSKPLWLINAPQAIIAYQNYTESSHSRKSGSNMLTNTIENANVVSGTFKGSNALGERSVLTYGIEADINGVASTAALENVVTGEKEYAESRYPAGYNDVTTGALYGCLKTSWNTTVTTVAGARYTRLYLHSQQNDTNYDSPQREAKINAGAPSGCLGVVVQPFDFWRMSLNGSSGFRAPNISDIAGIFKVPSGQGYVMVPNNNLEPEYAFSLDFGNTVQLGKNVDLTASTFMTRVNNFMVEDTFSFNGQETFQGRQVRSIINKGSANIGGGNINVELRFTRGISLKNTLTFTAGILNDTLLPLRAIPPLFGASHLLFKYNRVKGDLYVRYNGEKIEGVRATDMTVSGEERFLYPLNENGISFSPSWFTLNLATTMILTRELDLNLCVENILNRCYRPYANGIAAPGLNLVVAVRGRM